MEYSPRKGGGERPTLLPLLLPLAFVSGPSRNPQVDGPRSARDTVRRKRSAGKNRTMKRHAAEILKDALALPTEARAALAGSLLESLDTEVDEDAEAA
jgi:hypothetical protein